MLTFHTGYDKGFTVVMEKVRPPTKTPPTGTYQLNGNSPRQGAIFKNYISGWFWVDFSATVQWSAILEWGNYSTQSPLCVICHPLIAAVCKLFVGLRWSWLALPGS